MFFVIQLKEKPNEIILVRATSRLDAFNLVKVVDVPKRVWDLENFDTRSMFIMSRIINLGTKNRT